MDLEPGFQSEGPCFLSDQPDLSTGSSLGSHDACTQWVVSPAPSQKLPVGISGGLPVRGGFVEWEGGIWSEGKENQLLPLFGLDVGRKGTQQLGWWELYPLFIA